MRSDSPPATSFRRVVSRFERLAADGNIRPGHPAERASWVWMDGRGPHETAILKFTLDFLHESGGPLRFHVTADHRFQLFLDGELIACGPDRCDPGHWTVATLEGDLAAGSHRLTALVWYLAEDPRTSRMDPKHASGDLRAANPPMAQMSHRAGFLFCGDGDPALMDTGAASWRVCDLTAAFSMRGPEDLGYHDIGPEFTIDLAAFGSAAEKEYSAVVVAAPPVFNIHGVRSPGWVLASASLPEQRRGLERGGRIRAVRPWVDESATWEESAAGESAGWQALVDRGSAVVVPPATAIEILWDLERYVCGYPRLAWDGGAGSRIEFAWAESLFYERPGGILDVDAPRGNRAEISGKRWLGFGDAWIASGANHEEAPSLWWRSGRYVRVRIRTGDAPLTVSSLAILSTGYPLDPDWQWKSSDPEWDSVLPLLARGLELGAHETWVDSPYFEQMMYVGDNVMHAMSNYACYRDDRLTRRALELFDQSRAGSPGGLVAERYPCAWRQESATYAMLWPMMVRNHLMWRGDRDFVSGLLVGVRQLIESLLALRQGNGLLGKVPGWPFVDWVTSWNQGCGPGVREGDSSIVNLHLVLALQAAAEIEHELGEEILATRYREIACALFAKIVDRYWDEAGGMLRDTSESPATSEHAQTLALLTGLLDGERRSCCLRALVGRTPDAACTISFSFYLLDVLARAGEADPFFSRLQFWKALPAQGFVSLPEMPDPCRSDCHGWGAHPLYHSFASIAGIRPAAPGMEKVRISPMPGPLDFFRTEVIHRRGKIVLDFDRRSGLPVFTISLPAGIEGVLCWAGHERRFTGTGQLETFTLPVAVSTQ